MTVPKDDQNNNVIDPDSFKLKAKITGRNFLIGNTIDVEIAVSLKYFSNFWKTLEMCLINCEINLILTLSTN